MRRVCATAITIILKIIIPILPINIVCIQVINFRIFLSIMTLNSCFLSMLCTSSDSLSKTNINRKYIYEIEIVIFSENDDDSIKIISLVRGIFWKFESCVGDRRLLLFVLTRVIATFTVVQTRHFQVNERYFKREWLPEWVLPLIKQRLIFLSTQRVK